MSRRHHRKQRFKLHSLYVWHRYMGLSAALVALLTRDHGYVKVIAKAARRPNSRLRALVEPGRLVGFQRDDRPDAGTFALALEGFRQRGLDLGIRSDRSRAVAHCGCGDHEKRGHQ